MVNLVVKGEMTGRGALILTLWRTSMGGLRLSAASSLRFSAGLSEMASIDTRVALTEILDRGSKSSARNE